MVDVDIVLRVSSHRKGELAWAVDKWLRVVSTIMLFKKEYECYKELKETSCFKFKTILYTLRCYVALSNYFEIVSTVTFLNSQTELI